MAMEWDWGKMAKSFKPGTGGSKFKNGLEVLPDGETYKFKIESVEESDRSGYHIVTLNVVVTEGPHNGVQGKRESLMNDIDTVSYFCGDLNALGFDTEQWRKPGVDPDSDEARRYFTDCMARAMGCMKGIMFEGVKSTEPNKKNPEYPYTKIKKIKRLADGKPEKIGVAEMKQILEAIDF